jgi:hypothetical protein
VIEVIEAIEAIEVKESETTKDHETITKNVRGMTETENLPETMIISIVREMIKILKRKILTFSKGAKSKKSEKQTSKMPNKCKISLKSK